MNDLYLVFIQRFNHSLYKRLCYQWRIQGGQSGVTPNTDPQTSVASLEQGRTQWGGFGVHPPLELDILRKVHYLRKGD